MKKDIFYLIFAVCLSASCHKLNVVPQSIVQDADAFGSLGGVTAYMAGLYRYLPIEDFKYDVRNGFNQYSQFYTTSNFTGEGMNSFESGMENEGFGYWNDAYTLIRNANYFMQTIPQYAPVFNDTAEVDRWIGEAHFLRAYTYLALAKRYGGVPILTRVETYPQESLAELKVPRSSEQATWDFIGSDLDTAISMLGPASEQQGRANKYIAAGIKSRAMLYAGSIAKYNTIINVDNRSGGNGARVQGIVSSEAVRYFKAAYDAAKIVESGGFTLYRANSDKATNYYNLFFDQSGANTEVLFSKFYTGVLGEVGHNYDVFAVPYQLQGPQGYSSFILPTLDFIELFDGLPKNPDGSLQTTDAAGHYIYYAGQYGLFANAEPRLLGTVIVPGASFKSETIDIRRGIYTGDASGGIANAQLQPTVNGYTASSNFSPSTDKFGDPNIPVNPAFGNGAAMNSGGLSGIYGSHDQATLSGFYIRKYVDQTRPTAEVLQYYSNQPYCELRYAEVMLNRAEADIELHAAGQADIDYVQDAYTLISDIRDRAGAIPLANAASVTIDTVRKERRKELGFENKIFWDIRRWRTADQEINQRMWYVLNPIYVSGNGKYIYDRRTDERNLRFSFNIQWYYEGIPASELVNSGLYQNLTY